MVTAIFSFILSIYLFTGIYVISINPKKLLNKLFFAITICLVLQCIVALIVQLPGIQSKQNTAESWFILGSSTFYFTIFFLVLFYIKLTDYPKLKWYIVFLLVILPSYISYRVNAMDSIYTIELHDTVLYFSNFHPFMNVVAIFVNLYMFMMLFLIIRWFIKSTSKKNKRIALVLLVSQIISLVLVSFDQYILFYITKIKSVQIPGMYLPYFLFWFIGIGYVIIRFRFLVITPSYVNQDILKNMDESVILMDNTYKIVSINQTAQNTLLSNNHFNGENASRLIKEFDDLQKELKKLELNDETDFTCRLNFCKADNTIIYMDAKIKLIRDKFNDIIGNLIIARPVKEWMQLRESFKISDREVEVVQYVLTGKSNKEIAYELQITERTVKTHLTHIFNKMGIDNKIQLIMLLKDFNLIPGIQANKIVLFN